MRCLSAAKDGLMQRFAYELPDGSIAFSSAPEHREQAYLVVEKSLSLGRVVKFARDKAVQ